MRFFRWLLALFRRRPKIVEPLAPRVFNPFPITRSEYRKKTPGLPGSKIARRVMKVRGLPYNGEVYHTGELTEANNDRARRRAQAR